MSHSGLTLVNIHATARAALSVLASAGFQGCLVGSSACSGHGTRRTPNDVDLLILNSSANPEEIKAIIIGIDANFSLELPSNNLLASYRVLWYALPKSKDFEDRARKCRIDVLLPGTIKLPPIANDRVAYSQSTGLPLMPFLPTLLHKVLACVAHGQSPGAHARDKQANDVTDIWDLQCIAVGRSEEGLQCIPEARLEYGKEWLPDWFVEDAERGVKAFAEENPETILYWKAIGLTNL